jgi:hypothetical protein
MRRLELGMCVVLLGLGPSTLAAQPTGPSPGQSRLFGDVAIMADSATDGTRDGPALGLGISARLSPIQSLRFEVKIPKRLSSRTTSTTRNRASRSLSDSTACFR